MEQESMGVTSKSLFDYVINCKGANLAYSFCSDPECKTDSAVMCSNEACICQKQSHASCEAFTKLRKIFEDIQKKKRPESIKKNIIHRTQKFYDQMLEMISLAKQKAVLRLQYFGLEDSEVDFVKMIIESKENQIKGQLVRKVVKKLKIKRIFQLKQPTDKEYDNMWEKQKKVFDEFSSKLNKAVESLTIKAPFESKILEQVTQEYELKKFFPDQISQIKLLYRASQHNFSVLRFHQLCDGIKNTLTIVKTQADKIIGAFTPLQWQNKPGLTSENYKNDVQGKSFLFSISNGEKYHCNDTKHATYSCSEYGPTFGYGNSDFQINDESNNKTSNFSIGNSYNNGKINEKNQGAWSEFSGATDQYKITLKEWEVYQVVFS